MTESIDPRSSRWRVSTISEMTDSLSARDEVRIAALRRCIADARVRIGDERCRSGLGRTSLMPLTSLMPFLTGHDETVLVTQHVSNAEPDHALVWEDGT
jgi:hypothetical protein